MILCLPLPNMNACMHIEHKVQPEWVHGKCQMHADGLNPPMRNSFVMNECLGYVGQTLSERFTLKS